MKRTIALMTTARAKGVELPKGWWHAPERHLALVAACEAALGIQHEKEIVV